MAQAKVVKVSEKQKAAQEFDLIDTYLKPLATHPGALNLENDGALIAPALGHSIVVTSDSCIADVHFQRADDPRLVAKKCLRVNLSDLASMGATPLGYTLILHLPKDLQAHDWIKGFAKGLEEDQKLFNVSLLGGDMTQSQNDLMIGVTAFGEIGQGLVLPRSGAKPGDRIYATGSIGDAAMGLAILQGKIKPANKKAESFLTDRYFVPQPRLEIGKSLAGLATSAIDISDGLLSDLTHLCRASNLSAHLISHQVPWSEAFRETYKSYPKNKRDFLNGLFLTGGDDYELLFSVAPGDAQEIDFLQSRFDIPLTQIGHFGPKQKDFINIVTKHGESLHYEKPGYEHTWS